MINSLKVIKKHRKHILSILLDRKDRKYILSWVRSLQKDFLVKRPVPWLVFDAIAFIHRLINRKLNIFEYGSGGSTLFWLQKGAQVTSIEHSPEWFDTIRKIIPSHYPLDYRIIPPEEAFTGDLNAADPNSYVSAYNQYQGCSFKNYVTQVDSFPDCFFDMVLIDGRARSSCIKHSVQKVALGGTLIIDNSDRPWYFSETYKYLTNFERIDFCGIGPACANRWMTSVFLKKSI